VKGTTLGLDRLDGRRIGDYTLILGEVKGLRRSGWKGFKLYLRDASGIRASRPVAEGIHSVGGRHGIMPWMDLSYSEDHEFRESGSLKGGCRLGAMFLDREVFACLGEIVPPGGHLMVSYEGDQDIHEETMRALEAGIPPAATPLGLLLVLAGFQYVKDWYLAEGGFEGPRKLWGEKAPDDAWAQEYQTRSARRLLEFLSAPRRLRDEFLADRARRRAEEVLVAIRRAGR
jgi:hypothetical protein